MIRASKTTAVRYERDRPGELVHVDVKKIGKIPDGGGWKAHGRQMGSTSAKRRARIGYDYVHSMVDDHSRLAYSEILPDEKGPTCAAFMLRAAEYFAAHGITGIERVLTDNHWSYRRSTDVRDAIAARRQAQVHQAALSVAERQGREVQPDPAGRVGLPPGLPDQRRQISCSCALARALQHSPSPHRTRRAAADQPPVTNVMAEYT
jgi:hypothetical protein